MCAVFVDVYPFDGLAVDVPSGVGAFVDDEASFAPAGGEVCECGAEQAGAYDEIVVGEVCFINIGLLNVRRQSESLQG